MDSVTKVPNLSSPLFALAPSCSCSPSSSSSCSYLLLLIVIWFLFLCLFFCSFSFASSHLVVVVVVLPSCCAEHCCFFNFSFFLAGTWKPIGVNECIRFSKYITGKVGFKAHRYR